MPDKTMMILEKMMDITSYRRKLLTSNIANADTPGYKAKDISFKNEMNKAMQDIDNNIKVSQNYNVFETPNTMPNRDGNTVNVDLEMAKMAENSLTYNAAVQFYARKSRMLKDAIKVR
ncbi:MAG: flagellar basal body rod protein FlgB [Thermodesulfovibrionales bacterium]|nr:flagellar basal body rod protein FlgB [Thermodesulfovibrionales bacterium]